MNSMIGTAEHSHACPVCRSERTQRVSLLYRSEVTRSRFTMRGGDMVSRSGYASIGTASTRSLLAKELQPPRMRRVLAETVGVLIATLWLEAVTHSTALLYLIWLPAAAYAAWAARRNRGAGEARREWDRKFICMRCGQVFVPDAAGVAPVSALDR